MRRVFQGTWVAVGIAMLYLIWVFATRYLADREMERASKRRLEQTYRCLEDTGGTAVRILRFYASTGELTKGEQAIVCYGVQNARSVRIEPPVEKLKPAQNRCFWIAPEQTTTYALLAEGLDGAEVSESFTVKVNPAPPHIFMFALSGKEIVRGEPITMCYGVKNAVGVRLEPLGWPLRPVEKDCVRLYPSHTTNFTLVASGSNGRTDRAKFTVRVR